MVVQRDGGSVVPSVMKWTLRAALADEPDAFIPHERIILVSSKC